MDTYTQHRLLYELRKELSNLEWKKLGLNNLEPLKQEIDERINKLIQEKK